MQRECTTFRMNVDTSENKDCNIIIRHVYCVAKIEFPASFSQLKTGKEEIN